MIMLRPVKALESSDPMNAAAQAISFGSAALPSELRTLSLFVSSVLPTTVLPRVRARSSIDAPCPGVNIGGCSHAIIAASGQASVPHLDPASGQSEGLRACLPHLLVRLP